jgi:hypothetical protein
MAHEAGTIARPVGVIAASPRNGDADALEGGVLATEDDKHLQRRRMCQMTDRSIVPIDARTALAGLRPQPFGNGHPGRILDPIIEPPWSGIRALAAIDRDGVALVDEAGDPIAGPERGRR